MTTGPGLGRRLVGNTLHAASGRIASLLLWLVLTPPLYHALGVQGFAVWSLFFALAGWLGSLDLGLAPSVLRNIGSWRVKETDRIAAMAAELAKIGAEVEAGEDYLRVTPPRTFRSASIRTYDDHRMATAGAVLGLVVEGIEVRDIATTGKTLPEFVSMWSDMLAGSPA